MSHNSQDYVGRYRLLNLIRSGKTCQVWEVINDLSGERLAIKLLISEFRHDRAETGFLRHEFQVGRNLHHRRVVRIHEFGIDGDNVFLAMDLFAAPNIKQVIQQNFGSLEPVMRKCISHAAEGLAYFHTHGWVHRDIKPDNFLMKPDGDVKLIDYALAVRARKGLMRLFGGTKQVQGTRSYMSPEQIRGQPLDGRADLYSFGCMVYELLTGKLPFTGVSTADLLNKHLKSAPPSIQAHNRNLTDEVSNLVKRMMAKTPDARPKDVEAFLQEFHRIELYREPLGGVRK